MSLTVATSVLALALLADPSAAELPPAEAPERTPFVQVGFGGGMVRTRIQGFTDLYGGPTVELEAGALLQPRPRLRLSLGGSFAQTGYEPTLAAANTDLAAKLRIGPGHSRVWGYGIAGLGFSLVSEDGSDYNSFRAGGAALVGLGVRGGVGERWGLGFEVSSTLSWLPPRDTVLRVSGLFVVEHRFGR